MTSRQHTNSNTELESRFAYARAVRVGRQLHVSGTAAIEADGSVTAGGIVPQTERCLTLIAAALDELGGSLADVIRIRIYVTDVTQYELLSAPLRAAFADSPPTSTLVEVSGLIDPAMLVEIEAEAIIDEGDSGHAVRG